MLLPGEAGRKAISSECGTSIAEIDTFVMEEWPYRLAEQGLPRIHPQVPPTRRTFKALHEN